ncbi:MAG TPA: class I SAM-dependent methyltransferase [Chitinispirillaceae bacterium]|nr:class I SAM-dependent methyltransferase [Chitinispirillaceae bacterium]
MPKLSDYLFFRNCHVCPWWFCWSFDNKFRRLVQNPNQILSPYVHDGDIVADIGCGKGYFSVPMAKMVGKNGKVIAIDLQEKMLEALRLRTKKAGVSDRVLIKQVTGESLTSEIQVDFALSFWMLHEVPDQKRFLQNVYNLIKEGGRYLVVEPKVHVCRSGFLRSMQIAEDVGFSGIEDPNIFFSRARLMVKKTDN